MKIYKAAWLQPDEYFWDSLRWIGSHKVLREFSIDLIANAELGFAIRQENIRREDIINIRVISSCPIFSGVNPN